MYKYSENYMNFMNSYRFCNELCEKFDLPYSSYVDSWSHIDNGLIDICLEYTYEVYEEEDGNCHYDTDSSTIQITKLELMNFYLEWLFNGEDDDE